MRSLPAENDIAFGLVSKYRSIFLTINYSSRLFALDMAISKSIIFGNLTTQYSITMALALQFYGLMNVCFKNENRTCKNSTLCFMNFSQDDGKFIKLKLLLLQFLISFLKYTFLLAILCLSEFTSAQ